MLVAAQLPIQLNALTQGLITITAVQAVRLHEGTIALGILENRAKMELVHAPTDRRIVIENALFCRV